jgi:hypothetical protein
MARLTGKAVSEKFEKVGRFAANVTKGLGVGVAILGLAGCPQPTNGGDINPNDPTTHTVDDAGYDLVIPKPEIGWSNTRAQNEVSTAMTFLKDQCNTLYTYASRPEAFQGEHVGLVVNTAAPLNFILTSAYNRPNILTLADEVNSALNTLHAVCFPAIVGSTNIDSFKDQFNAFRMGSRAEQQNFMCKLNETTALEDTQGKQNAQNAFNGLITDIKQNYGVNNLPQSGDYKTTLAQLRANLNGFIPATADKAFFNNLLQMVEDVEQFIGFVTDLGGLQKNVQLQAQAHANSNVKIAFPEPQAQPKLTRAEIQAQHGIVNSEELATRNGCYRFCRFT